MHSDDVRQHSKRSAMSALTMAQEKIYTVKEIAEILRTTKRTVWKLVRDGEIEAFKVRDEYRITQRALEAFIERDARKKGE